MMSFVRMNRVHSIQVAVADIHKTCERADKRKRWERAIKWKEKTKMKLPKGEKNAAKHEREGSTFLYRQIKRELIDCNYDCAALEMNNSITQADATRRHITSSEPFLSLYVTSFVRLYSATTRCFTRYIWNMNIYEYYLTHSVIYSDALCCCRRSLFDSSIVVLF